MRKAIFAAIAILLSSSVLFAASPCTNPTLTITGIQGDGCGGSVEFTSASYSTSTNELKVLKYMDQSSPKLFSDCASGTHIQKVQLSYPNMSTDGTNHPTVVTFEDVLVTQVDESVNPTNETVQLKYAKWKLESGGGQTTGGSVRGSARGGTLNVAVVGGDGRSQTASHFQMTVRAGGVTTTSLQLLSPTPPPIRAGTLKAMTPANAAPQLDHGTIELRGPNGALISSYSFSGGVFNGNNLRTSKVNLAREAAIRP